MKVVLHICCGVCAAGAVKRLTAEGHGVVGVFYNPNVHPSEEYARRLEAAREVARQLHFPLEVPPYDSQEWFKEVVGLESEPEGGRRCEVCFRLRLKRTRWYMEECGGDAFTSTLTISPYKSAETINRIGRELDGKRFLVRDFKKKEGFRRAVETARKLGLYRQSYCGCLYSMREQGRATGIV
ncbi:epoxyqueuosine reductase QueH [Chloroflexota bacterium]